MRYTVQSTIILGGLIQLPFQSLQMCLASLLKKWVENVRNSSNYVLPFMITFWQAKRYSNQM